MEYQDKPGPGAGLRGKKVLVTGADGFIGSHLTEALVRAGCQVRAFTLYNSFNSWGWLDHCAADVRSTIEIHAGDVRDPFSVQEAVKDRELVFHLAALIAIPFSYRAPGSYVETNIQGTLHVLQAAREHGVARVVHTSTSEVYGTARVVPITEEHPLEGQSPYSATKIGADQLALSYYRSFGTPVVVVRPFNTYGPRQSARAMIPTVITQLASGRKAIRLGSLHPTRDFNYVADTVEGFLAAGAAPGAMGEVVNLSTGFEISVGDTAKLIAELMGVQATIEVENDRVRPKLSEVERLCGDNSKALALLGWRPRHSGLPGLREGLSRTIDWFRNPEHLRNYKADLYNI